MDLSTHYLQIIRQEFRKTKALGDKTFAQLQSDDEYHWSQDPEVNSIAIVIQHIAGNMISRWTDFLTTDGEKPNRDRDTEFEERLLTSDELLERWEQGWKVFLGTLDSLTEDDLLKTIYIRKEPHSALQAIERQMAHYAYHVGQIVHIAKEIRGESWQTLSIARGKSKDFTPV